MKKLLLAIGMILSFNSFAQSEYIIACVKSPASNEFIAVIAEGDSNTGLTHALDVFQTFDRPEYCLGAIDGDIELELAYTGQPASQLASKRNCYQDVEFNDFAILVNEVRDIETGLVVKLEPVNEFDSLAACQSNL